MRVKNRVRWLAAAAVAGLLLGWPIWALATFMRYGHPAPGRAEPSTIDGYMPVYDVSERHETRVAAAAPITWDVVASTGLQSSPLVRTIIRTREKLMGVRSSAKWPEGGTAAQLQAWGWGVLAQTPGREIVLGTVTRPWEGNVRFRALPPPAFADFDSAGYVKIVVAISVDARGTDSSSARVQTRVATTDPVARARFRRYWAQYSPGIILIRRAHLQEVKREAERRQAAPRAPAAATLHISRAPSTQPPPVR